MHLFNPSKLDQTICAICKRDEFTHSPDMECECCGSKQPNRNGSGNELIVHMNDMILCAICRMKDLTARQNIADTANARIKEHNSNVIENQVTHFGNITLEMSKQLDQTIQVKTDIFNANIISIAQLKDAIWADDSITNKHFKLAEILTARFNHLQDVIFKARETQIAAGNEQKSIHQYLNDLSNKLRKEEREKLQLKDINYKPESPKLDKIKPPSVKKTDKEEIRKYCSDLSKELGLPIGEQVLQMIMLRHNMSVEQASNHFRRTFKESMS